MVGAYTEGDEPVPGFRLVSMLGWGRFGEVWKAAGPGGIAVAFKIIPLGNRQGLKEFRAIRLIKQVRHPNLVPILAFWLKDKHGAFIDDGLADEGVDLQSLVSELLIAMGLGERSLFDRFQECRDEGRAGVPAGELLGYLEDAARAIDYLNRPIHDFGRGPVAIQHCDIKPHNILLVGGMAQVCDLGVARVLEDTRVSAATGSAAYIAPEFIRESRPSRSTDQYSLAISYVELRTGSLPFSARSAAAAYLAHIEGKLDLSHLPEAERVVLARATERDPEKRFPSCTAFAQALRAVCDVEAEELPLPGVRPIPEDLAPRSRKATLVHRTDRAEPEEELAVTGDDEAWPRIAAPDTDAEPESYGAFPSWSPETELADEPVAASGSFAQPCKQARRAPERSPRVAPSLGERLAQEWRTRLPGWRARLRSMQVPGAVRKALAVVLDRPAQRHAAGRRRSRLVAAVQVGALFGGLAVVGYTGSIFHAAERPPRSTNGNAGDVATEAGSVSGTTDADRHAQAGKRLVADGFLARAEAEFSAALRANPTLASAFIERAIIRSELSRDAEAVADCDEAIRLGLQDARSFHTRAVAELRRGDWTKALADCSYALQSDPQYGGAFYTRSQAQTAAKHFAEAMGDYESALRHKPLGIRTGQVQGLAYSADGQWLGAAAEPNEQTGSVKVWRTGEDRPRVFPGHTTLAFSLDGRYVAAAFGTDDAAVWDLNTGREVVTLAGHVGAVRSVAFAPDGRHLATASADGSAKVWELATGTATTTFAGHLRPVLAVAWSPDGSLLATGGEDETVRVWKAVDGAEVWALRGHAGAVASVAFRKDGRQLASGSFDRTVRFWDLASGKESATLPAQAGEVCSVAYSPDGRRVAAACCERAWMVRPGQVRVWDVATGRLVTCLGGHTAGVQSVAFRGDGKELVSGSTNWQVKSFDTSVLDAGKTPLDKNPAGQ